MKTRRLRGLRAVIVLAGSGLLLAGCYYGNPYYARPYGPYNYGAKQYYPKQYYRGDDWRPRYRHHERHRDYGHY